MRFAEGEDVAHEVGRIDVLDAGVEAVFPFDEDRAERLFYRSDIHGALRERGFHWKKRRVTAAESSRSGRAGRSTCRPVRARRAFPRARMWEACFSVSRC